VYFPPANNFFSELLIAGYQKYLESGTLGLTNATQSNVQIMNQYRQTGLQVDGHSRGGMTTGNAVEAVTSQSNAQGSLSGTDISLFGSAYNAQQAADLLNKLGTQDKQGTVQSTVHIDDFVGTIIGNNPATGGTTPINSNLLKEWVKIFYGDFNLSNLTGESAGGKWDLAPTKTGGTRADLDGICGADNKRCVKQRDPVTGELVLDEKGIPKLALQDGKLQWNRSGADNLPLTDWLATPEGKKIAGLTGGHSRHQRYAIWQTL